MTPKQIMKSFALEGKISQRHGEQIEEMLTEALRERDELLEEVNKVFNLFDNYGEVHFDRVKDWLTKYKKLLDKDKDV